MSHFYIRKSYSFEETDYMMLNIKKEMSNFLTKEEAIDLLKKRDVIIDPPPYNDYSRIDYLYEKVFDLERKLTFALSEIDKLKNTSNHPSP